MKKWILFFCLFLLVSTASVYFFIPAKQNFSYATIITNTKDGASRIILDENKWQYWWPGKKENDTIYSYKNYNYRIRRVMLNSLDITVFNTTDSSKGSLQITESGIDSAGLIWTSAFNFSANPLERLIQYKRSYEIKSNIRNFLNDLTNYFDKQENIYGMKVVEGRVTDSSLISVKETFPHYPTTEEIYAMVQSLRDYIHKKGGEESNYPMLNVHFTGAGRYETIVAIPTRKDLPSEGKFLLKKMILGYILKAEVKGGIYTVMRGEKELENYANDHKKMSPAIPFETLVTNRLQEKDTTKWITGLYYPVFY